MDESGDNVLSFLEFQQACRSMHLSPSDISDDDLRLLFTRFTCFLSIKRTDHQTCSFDTNGDGDLQFDEFMEAMRGSLRNGRRKVVQNAYAKLNHRGKTSISLADAVKVMNTNFHADVLAGHQSAQEALGEFIDYFSAKGEESSITLEGFLNYYANVSAFVDRDDDFIKSVQGTWGLGSKAPAPPTIMKHNTYGAIPETDDHVIFHNKVFTTQVSSGDIITWQQEQSQFESLGEIRGKSKKSLGAVNDALVKDGGKQVTEAASIRYVYVMK